MTWLIDNLIINLIELFNDAKLSTCIKIHEHFTKVGTMVNIQIVHRIWYLFLPKNKSNFVTRCQW